MKDNEINWQKNFWKLVFLMTILITIIMGLLILEVAKTKYYREQMVSFCKIAEIQKGIIKDLNPELEIPDLSPCDRWYLNWDYNRR